MSGEVSSNTDTFLEMENNNPIPITSRISIKRWTKEQNADLKLE
jgi:hypothetical protein